MIEQARAESFGLINHHDESNDISRTNGPWIPDHEVYFTHIIDRYHTFF